MAQHWRASTPVAPCVSRRGTAPLAQLHARPLPRGAARGEALLGVALDGVDHVVVVGRVVVEQEQPAGVRGARRLDRSQVRRVAPALAAGAGAPATLVLGLGVLGVVDEQIHVAPELEQRLVHAAVVGVLGVGGDAHRVAERVDAVAERALGMAQRAGADAERADVQLVAGRDRAEDLARRHGGERHREARRLHLPAEHLLERRAVGVRRPVQAEHAARHESRREEREALDVVPVHVAEEDVSRERHLLDELLAEQA
jgi:hypothetical protein